MKRWLSVTVTLLCLLILAVPAFSQGGNGGSNNSTLLSGQGRPIAGANIAICQPLATTATSVNSVTGLATYTMASNPQTAGYVAGMTVLVAGFTGGDTYFNAGSLIGGTISAGQTIANVTTTAIVTYLTHSTASASSNGTILQEGNSSTPCAGLVPVYTDNTLSVTTTNPFTSDGYGNWNFWAAPGLYYYQFYGASVATNMKQSAIGCVPSASVGSCGITLAGNNIFTGANTFTGTSTFDNYLLIGGSGYLDYAETAAVPSPTATQDLCYGDSTAHAIKCSYNGGTFYTVPLLGVAQNWSATQSFGVQPLPAIAGAVGIGSTAFPWSDIIIGTSSGNSTNQATSATANRTVTWPDASGVPSLQTVTQCGTMAACSATLEPGKGQTVNGTIAFSSSTTASITGMPTFTSSTSYNCVAADPSHSYTWLITAQTATGFTITSGTSNSDTWNWTCHGY